MTDIASSKLFAPVDFISCIYLLASSSIQQSFVKYVLRARHKARHSDREIIKTQDLSSKHLGVVIKNSKKNWVIVTGCGLTVVEERL